MVRELMIWHASLLQSILDRQQHPGMADARKCGAKDEKEWRKRRQEEKGTAKANWREGKYLANERDIGPGTYFFHMSKAEQQKVEDQDAGRLQKRYKATTIEKLPPFRGKMLPSGIS